MTARGFERKVQNLRKREVSNGKCEVSKLYLMWNGTNKASIYNAA